MLRERLLALAEPGYREFIVKLIPNIDPETVLGVRTPLLRRLAGNMSDRDAFLNALPHSCFEENQLHCFLLEGERDFATAVQLVDRFLPYVDNWATCDQLRPSVFRFHREELLPYIRKWLKSDHPYTIRFGMEMLMLHYLKDWFSTEYPEWVVSVHHADYYVEMMQAWYLATALAYQFDAVLPYLEDHRLDLWIHNKAIQKAVESRRISKEQKEYLKSLRRK